MGLFKKQPAKTATTVDDTVDMAEGLFDKQYREELRELGREHLKKLIEAGSADLKSDIDAAMRQATDDLKEYMTRQLDVTVSAVNTEITNQLNERISEFNRVTSEAQEMATQSLNRNAQAVYDKYQQFSATLQQTIASQEVMMITVFQDNKAKLQDVQNEQNKALDSIRESADASRRQSEEIAESLRSSIEEQSKKLSDVYRQNLDSLESTNQAQAGSIDSLKASTEELKKQYDSLKELLDKSVAEQKAMMIETINDHMARIVEHYLIEALGEQSDLKAQLPSILEQMEKNKQAMVEDMKL